MKAISVKQPWAYALVDGAKTIEVRSWSTDYRGELLICASSEPKNVFWDDDGELRLLHAGCMIGVVELKGCRKMTRADDAASMGNYQPNSYAWEISAVGFCVPKKIIQRLRLFEVDASEVEMLQADGLDAAHLFDYDPPQGAIPYTERCPVIG